MCGCSTPHSQAATAVEYDPASKIVLVRGASDLAAINALVAMAGYTPSAAWTPQAEMSF